MESEITNCPACKYVDTINFDTCPKCGVIVKKYIEKLVEREQMAKARKEKLEEEERKKQLAQQEAERKAQAKILKNEQQDISTDKTQHKIKMSWALPSLLGLLVLLLLVTGKLSSSPTPYEPPPITSNWNTSTNIEIQRTLVANNVKNCGLLEWQHGARSTEFIVKCSMDNQNWTTYQVWTAINAVNIYGR